MTAQWSLISTVKSFDYTGGQQTYTIPYTGYYKLEVWGASGGSATANNSTIFRGGYGAYSIGITQANKSNVLYVIIGSGGVNGVVSGKTMLGGYNGGGAGKNDSAYSSCGGGGGASHISTKSGTLKDLSIQKTSVLIVAGGGGGGSYHTDSPNNAGYNRCAQDLGGNGGGMNGINGSGGSCHSGWTGWGYGGGGTQTTGGTTLQYPNNSTYGPAAGFGYGGEGMYNAGGGGGAGWYGGGGGHGGSGGGGSGYIGSSNLISGLGVTKHMNCYSCTTSTVAATRTNSNTNVSGTATADYSKTGNGYARITWMGDTL